MRQSLCIFAAAIAALASGCTIDANVATLSADASGKQFETVPAGGALRDDATCAALVRPTSKEPRPMNGTFNGVLPTAAQLGQLAPWDSSEGYDAKALALEARISGAFTGHTTDEILQWVACKWGFDEDLVRAEAAVQTSWQQGAITDYTTTTSACPNGAATRMNMAGMTECAQTYGMFMVLWKYHESAWPMYRDSTSFHVDYVFALRRACFEGYELDQANRVAPGQTYKANDLFGCMGAHRSGIWYDDVANTYIMNVQTALANRPWEQPGFCKGVPGCVLPR